MQPNVEFLKLKYFLEQMDTSKVKDEKIDVATIGKLQIVRDHFNLLRFLVQLPFRIPTFNFNFLRKNLETLTIDYPDEAYFREHKVNAHYLLVGNQACFQKENKMETYAHEFLHVASTKLFDMDKLIVILSGFRVIIYDYENKFIKDDNYFAAFYSLNELVTRYLVVKKLRYRQYLPRAAIMMVERLDEFLEGKLVTYYSEAKGMDLLSLLSEYVLFEDVILFSQMWTALESSVQEEISYNAIGERLPHEKQSQQDIAVTELNVFFDHLAKMKKVRRRT